MAIIDDYAGIAAELRRLQAQRAPKKAATDARTEQDPPAAPRHRMRSTPAGELLYRRLVLQGRR